MENMEKEAALLKLLGDPLRLRLAALLAAEEEVCVCHLAGALDEPDYKISRHLGLLRSAGLVETRREGTWIYYSLRKPAGKLEKTLWGCFRTCFIDHPATQQDRSRLKKVSCS